LKRPNPAQIQQQQIKKKYPNSTSLKICAKGRITRINLLLHQASVRKKREEKKRIIYGIFLKKQVSSNGTIAKRLQEKKRGIWVVAKVSPL
jgi:hypothetical protein